VVQTRLNVKLLIGDTGFVRQHKTRSTLQVRSISLFTETEPHDHFYLARLAVDSVVEKDVVVGCDDEINVGHAVGGELLITVWLMQDCTTE
jgi:hypothetical protein